MKIKHEDIRYPSIKFNSCIEGRIFSLFEYFLEDKNRKNEFYYLLCQCSLKHEPIQCIISSDPWYYQPLNMYFNGLYEFNSEEGYKCMEEFMQNYGIIYKKLIVKKQSDVASILETIFRSGAIPIVIIDQYNYIKSNKYRVQKNAIHAVLLSGIDTEKELFWVIDTGKEKEYTVSYKELISAVDGEIIYMYKGLKNSIQGLQLKSKGEILLLEQSSIEARISYIMEMKKFMSYMRGVDKYIFEGNAITIKYKILPYIFKTQLYLKRMDPQYDNNIVNKLIEQWEYLSKIYLKSIIRNIKDPSLDTRLVILEEMETSLLLHVKNMRKH